MSANDHQVGGSHYKSGYEHWDLVLSTRMGYLEGCATKYIARHRKKAGLIDLEKAKHYLSKILENVEYLKPRRQHYPFTFMESECERFAKENKLDKRDQGVLSIIVCWRSAGDIELALEAVALLAESYQPKLPFAEQFKPGTPEDGGHHA